MRHVSIEVRARAADNILVSERHHERRVYALDGGHEAGDALIEDAVTQAEAAAVPAAKELLTDVYVAY